MYPSLVIALPDWVSAFMEAAPDSLPSAEERMGLAIALARENVVQGGGPFGALIVESESGRIVAPGVNLVVPLRCSLAHAEMVAFAVAQQVAGTYDLGGHDLPPLELVTSTEPCAMCLGAIPWSGVHGLICGATCDDAESVGFDEGAKPDHWAHELELRGISVQLEVRRAEAAEVLAAYGRRGGRIYNGRARRRSGEPAPAP